ncbi:MAG: LLM class flavin-dependent oxidoreductase [Actinomycetota bacterium]
MVFPWGVWFEPTQPVQRLADLAQLAESEGAQVCFVADEGTERDVYVALTAVLLATKRLVVAPAITNPFSRHPVTTAAAVATLNELAPGRVWNGLGVGGSRVLEPLRLNPQQPLNALKEAVRVNRQLLTGRADGPARLPWSKGFIPLAMAGRGPKAQTLAATSADWVILSAKPLAALPDTSARIRALGSAKIAWSAYVAYDEHERRRVLRHFTYMALDAPPEIRAATGLDDDSLAGMRNDMLAGRLEQASERLPETLVDHFAVSGSPDECFRRIRALRPFFDLFLLPLNDERSAENHIRISAGILRAAQAEA